MTSRPYADAVAAAEVPVEQISTMPGSWSTQCGLLPVHPDRRSDQPDPASHHEVRHRHRPGRPAPLAIEGTIRTIRMGKNA
jgi:hypothetical protein